MRNNKGVTLVALLATIMIMIILGALTIPASIRAYKQMKFESSKAEIEEMQAKVDEISRDYETYLVETKDEINKSTYKEYFQDRYDAYFDTIKEMGEKSEKLKSLIEKYPNLETSDNAFYFTTMNINKYFNLKGINDVVVDFNTRTVYSANGIKDPITYETYYELSELEESSKVEHKEQEDKNNIFSVKQVSKYYDNDFLVVDLELSINKQVKDVQEVQLSKDEFLTIEEVRNKRVVECSRDFTRIRITVRTEVEEEKTEERYRFKVITLSKEIYESEEIEIK